MSALWLQEKTRVCVENDGLGMAVGCGLPTSLSEQATERVLAWQEEVGQNME